MGFFRTKSIAFLEQEASRGPFKLERSLGPGSLVLLGVGAIIGAGLFSVTGIAAAEHAGPAVILSFLLAAIGCAFAGLCFSELASMIPVAGGAYSYTYATLGELVAWIIGWTLILEYAAGAALVSISWSAYFLAFLEDLHVPFPLILSSSPWQAFHVVDGETAVGWINVPALFLVAATSFLLIFGVEKSAAVNAALVGIKVAVVLLFICLGLFYVAQENYTPFIPENRGVFGEYGWSGVFKGASLVFLAYIGFDAVATTAQEVRNPQRNLPIGIIGSLVVCTILYVLFAYVMVGLVPFHDLGTAAPVAAAVNKTPFLWLNSLIKLAILAGLTSVTLVLLQAQSRIFFTMSRDGLLPAWLSYLHPKYHTPWLANLLLMALVGGFSAFAPLSLVGELTSMGTLFIFAVVCLSVMVLRRTHPRLHRPFKTPWVPLVPLLGIAVCLTLMLSLGADAWWRLFCWMSGGLIAYGCYGRSHSHLASP